MQGMHAASKAPARSAEMKPAMYGEHLMVKDGKRGNEDSVAEGGRFGITQAREPGPKTGMRPATQWEHDEEGPKRGKDACATAEEC